MSEEKTPGQVAYEARQAAKGRRMGADDSTPDSEIVAVIGLGWDELPIGMQADEEAGAQAVLDNRSPWGDANVVTVEQHRWYAVIRSGGAYGEVVKVIGNSDDGLCYYDSVDEWEQANA
jgi:hypothetical protein